MILGSEWTVYSQYSVWLASLLLLLSGQHKTKHFASDQTTPQLAAIPHITTQARGQSAQTEARRKLQLQECPLWLGALRVPNSLLRSGILLSQEPRSCYNSCTTPCSLPHQHEPGDGLSHSLGAFQQNSASLVPLYWVVDQLFLPPCSYCHRKGLRERRPGSGSLLCHFLVVRIMAGLPSIGSKLQILICT